MAMVNWLRELEHLVVPIECPGCGLRDVAICQQCRAWLQGPLCRVEHQVPRLEQYSGTPVLPVWALGAYVGPARGLVVAWKDRGREDLTRVFGSALVAALPAQPALPAPPAQGRHLSASWFPQVDAVIPMPSSRASVRHRGYQHLAAPANMLAKALAAKSVPLLAKSSRGDQVGQSARARGSAQISLKTTPWAALSGRQQPQLRPGARVLLFDDVVTTGATLAAARNALNNHGYHVVGAVVLAATPPRSGQRENVQP